MRETPTIARSSAERMAARGDLGRVLTLAAGDAVAFLVFAGVGRASHQEAGGLSALLQVAGTALPFALGWFIVAPLAGAFRRARTDTPGKMLRRTEFAWLAAWPASLLLRLALAPDHALPMPFPFIVLAFVAPLLGLWRISFALVEHWLRRR